MLQKNKMVTALNRAREAIESTYIGVCDVIERCDVRDENTKITRKNKEVKIAENQPCKLSFEKLNAVSQSDTAARITQGIKLFLAPEIQVKAGSKIVVEQNGVKTEYFSSSEPAVYSSHQEIILELFKGWA